MKVKTLLATAGLVFSVQSWAIDTTAWTCSNLIGCGTSTADGVVTDAPVAGTTGYAWVSTQINADGSSPGDFDLTKLPTGVPNTEVRNGATYTSPLFAVPAANAPISFQFNYVTSDGAGFSDFAWARLLDASGNEVALLFTARTDPVESVVPGNGMPPHQATLTPPSVPIIAGAPTWTPLGTAGGGTGTCYNTGCGYSGWIEATYNVPAAGSYRLEIGVVNWSDNAQQSGLAVDGLLVAGQLPSSLALTNPGTLPAFTQPVYSGSVANPGTSTTVDLVVTGPNGYVENIQATLNPDNTYTTQGAGLPAGQYSVTATLTGTSSTQTQEFTVTALPVTPPVINDASFSTQVNKPVTGNAGDGGQVPPDSVFEVLTPPTQGQLSIDPSTGAFTYTPIANFTGTATATVRVCLPTPNSTVCDDAVLTFNVQGNGNGSSPTPVPALGGVGLLLLSGIVAGTMGFMRRRKSN